MHHTNRAYRAAGEGLAGLRADPINFVYGNLDFLGQYVEDLLSLVAAIDRSEDVPDGLRARIDEIATGTMPLLSRWHGTCSILGRLQRSLKREVRK